MDERLKATIAKIKALSEQNPEFAKELRKTLEITSSAPAISPNNKMENDIAEIRNALELRGNHSVNYDFILNKRLRDQLLLDNYRMENAALNLKENESERFYTFCVNAFYQLENAVNYYFFYKFKDIKELVKVVADFTEQEPSEGFRYGNLTKGTERVVSDIPIAHKINALCNILLPDDPIKIRLGTLKQVRNEGAHRCMVILEKKEVNEHLYNFFQKNSFNTVRIDLIKIINSIKDNIDKPVVNQKKIVTATIESVLPGTCFVKYEGKSVQLKLSLLSKVKGMKKDESVTLTVINGVITDIQKEL